MKRIIITESQFERLKLSLNEVTAHSILVKKLKEELIANYEPIEKYVREGGDYKSTAMIKVKADDEEISLNNLREYLKYKFEIDSKNNKFVEQVIEDWMFGRLDDNILTKNIALI
jgi:hypothetical protein